MKSRTKMIGFTGTLMAVVLAGCANGSNGTQAESDGTPGGTVSVAITQAVTGNIYAGGIGDQVMAGLTHEGLTRPGRDSNVPEPALATSWEGSEDGRVWTFKLREGVQWHDDEPFTADDVKFTFDLMTSNKVLSPGAVGLGSYQRTEVVSPLEVRLHFADPEGNIPLALTNNVNIVPKHILEKLDVTKPTEYMKKPIGTGPFRFVSSKGDSTIVERSPNWWGGEAKLETVVLKVRDNPASSIAQLQSGDLDFAGVPAGQAKVLNGGSVSAFGVPTRLTYTVALRMKSPDSPYRERLVRQALNYAVDKEQIVKQVLQGFGKVADGPLPLSVTSEPTGVSPYPYDPKQAAQLLDEAGWVLKGDTRVKDGRPLKITLTATPGIPDTPQIAEVVQQEFKKLGIQTDINLVSRTEQYVGLLADRFDTGVEYAPIQPTGNIYNLFGCEGNNNRSAWCSEDTDKLINTLNAAATEPDRQAAMAALQENLRNEAPMLWVAFPDEVQAVSKRVQNLPRLQMTSAMQYMWDVTVTK